MVHSLVRPTHAMPWAESRISQGHRGTNTTLSKTALELTLPQSLREEELADAIFCFFLLSFNFSPAKTTSLASFRHSGQYLKSLKIDKQQRLQLGAFPPNTVSYVTISPGETRQDMGTLSRLESDLQQLLSLHQPLQVCQERAVS